MAKTVVACVMAWLIPGAGHVFLQRGLRGALFFGVVMLLFGFGLSMDGELFSLAPGFFGALKFIADAAIGIPYFLGRMSGWGQGDIHAYGYEYGNTFLYTAGLINMLLVLDTYDIAQGRKA